MKKYLFLDKRSTIFKIIFSVLFSFTQVIGFNCYKFDSAMLYSVFTYLFILILIPFVYFFTSFLWNIPYTKQKNSKISSILFEKKYSFFLLVGLMLLAWTPILIILYPGNFSYDAGTQIRMLKFDALSKYHPVLHTLFMGLTILLGHNLFGSWNIGILLHSILQMLIMSSIFSFTLLYLHKKRIPNIYNYIFLILYLFLPTHSVFAITTTKDILFSGFFNIVLLLFIELLTNPDQFFTKKKIFITIFFTFLLIAFRNNMLYAFIVFIPFALFYLKKYFKKVIILFLSILAIVFIYDKSLTYVFHIENGPRVEMFSFVVQQFARTYHKDPLSLEERQNIEKLYLNDSLQDYHPHISDPVKSNFNTEELLANKGKYASLYTHLLFEYPNTFIDSILNNTYSFFYLFDKLPDEGAKTYIEISCLKEENGTIDRNYTCGKNNSFIYQLVMDAKYQHIPILDIFMNMAFYFIVLIYVSIYLLYQKNYKLFVPILLLILYMGTNFLAPVAIVRYAYPLFTTFPILIYFIYQTKKDYLKK